MKRVLLHVCCAHCAAHTVAHFRAEGYDITAYWYNPNIHPYNEHQSRLTAMQRLAAEMDLPLIIAPGYEMPEYFRRVVGHEAERCGYCFELRLNKTAELALKKGFNAFTTTLLISPHQQHEILKDTGEKVAAASGIDFLYADLRKRYSDSRRITKPLDLYRQQYCGCLYSEWERYRPKMD